MKNQMIEKELYILRTLKSDYCVKYYGIEITPKEMHIFMQDCEGWYGYNNVQDYLSINSKN